MKVNVFNIGKVFPVAVLIAGLLITGAQLQAQPTAHYVPGSEGLSAASVPPPGSYFLDYTAFYTADSVYNRNGDEITPPDFRSTVFATVPRFVRVTEKKVLGGFLGYGALIPLQYTRVDVAGTSQSSTSVGDLLTDAHLSWHTDRFDAGVGVGIWSPVGNTGKSTDAGLGYWGCMFTYGATYYFDEDKTLNVSALGRYEINTKHDGIRTGDALTIDWGISKTLPSKLTIGLAGYFQRKVKGDTGPGAFSELSSIMAIGPEIKGAIPSLKMLGSLRYTHEFEAKNRAQGDTLLCTLVKRF